MSQLGQSRHFDRAALTSGVCTENLNTGVAVMKSAKDGA
ncbi:hypothetical protein V1289_007001 [Bradyrhizobium sp. AZCC 2289]